MEQQNLQAQGRRENIQELWDKGHSQRGIASILHVELSTVNRDISYLREQAKSVSYIKILLEHFTRLILATFLWSVYCIECPLFCNI